MHEEPAGSGRFKDPGVGNGVRAGVDIERVDSVGNDRPGVDQCELPIPEMSCACDGVIDIDEGRFRTAAVDYILAVVRQRNVATPLQRGTVDENLEIRLAARGIE